MPRFVRACPLSTAHRDLRFAAPPTRWQAPGRADECKDGPRLARRSWPGPESLRPGQGVARARGRGVRVPRRPAATAPSPARRCPQPSQGFVLVVERGERGDEDPAALDEARDGKSQHGGEAAGAVGDEGDFVGHARVAPASGCAGLRCDGSAGVTAGRQPTAPPSRPPRTSPDGC
jgi:hypothetical protein